jgi:KaiC/GvpD/RAD55 family RecA-like ATPase
VVVKDKSLTVLVTGEAGDGQVTRQGLEEYVSDCVIVRRLRIVKYRGSTHGTNEYPFLIDAQRDIDYVDGNGLRRFDRAHFERYSRP